MNIVDWLKKGIDNIGTVCAKYINDDNEIMMITTEGIIIQIRVNEISVLKRITSGVKLINLDEGVNVAQVALVHREIPDEEFDDIIEENIEELSDEDKEE